MGGENKRRRPFIVGRTAQGARNSRAPKQVLDRCARNQEVVDKSRRRRHREAHGALAMGNSTLWCKFLWQELRETGARRRARGESHTVSGISKCGLHALLAPEIYTSEYFPLACPHRDRPHIKISWCTEPTATGHMCNFLSLLEVIKSGMPWEMGLHPEFQVYITISLSPFLFLNPGQAQSLLVNPGLRFYVGLRESQTQTVTELQHICLKP